MNLSDRLQKSLLDLSRTGTGERLAAREFILKLLANHLVFSPVSLITDVGDARGTKKAKVVTLTEGEAKYIPIFTEEHYFLDWSADRYQCLPLRGADIAMTTPKGTGLLINPELPTTLYLEPDEVALLATLEGLNEDELLEEEPLEIEEEPRGGAELPDNAGNAENIVDQDREAEPAILDFARSFETVESDTLAKDRGVRPPGLRQPQRQDSPEGPSSRSPSHQSPSHQSVGHQGSGHSGFAELMQDFSTLFQLYPEIREAYLVDSREDYTEGVLGLLTENLTVERRFVLITEVGEISRAHFGFAGAIECYTDLHTPHSSSWELFKLEAPFYQPQGDLNDSADRQAAVARNRVANSDSIDGDPMASEDEGINTSTGSLWSALKKKRLRFFRNAN